MAYRVIRINAEHVPRVAELTLGLWSPDLATNTAVYAWKYLANPYSPEPLLYLALEGDEVVGMRGFAGARWEVDGELIDVPMACDLVVAEQHRNRGVFNLIMDHAMRDLRDRGYRFVFNLGGTSVLTRWSQLGLGWKGIGSLDIQRKCAPQTGLIPRSRAWLQRNPRLLALWSRVRPLLFKPVAERRRELLFQRLERRAETAGRPVTVHRSPNSCGMAEVVSRIAHDGRIRHLRDAEYFNWRFGHPVFEHRYLLYGAPQPEGYLVLAAGRFGPESCQVRIADWEATSIGVARQLLAATLQWSGFDDVRIWTATLQPEFQRLLETDGFVSAEEQVCATQPQRTVYVGRVPGVDDWTVKGRDLRDLGNWDLRMLFSDG